MWVGSALPPQFRRGRAEGRQFPTSGLLAGPGTAKEEGRRRGLGRSWREKIGDRPPGREEPAHRTQPLLPPPGSLVPHSRTGKGWAPFLQSRDGMRSPLSRGLKGKFTDACEGKPNAQGHLEWSPK